MMGQIYKSATRVLICVGFAGSESAPGLRNLAGSMNQMIDQALYHTIYGGRNDSVTESWPEQHSEKTLSSTSPYNNGAPGSDFDYRSAVERCLDVPRWNIFPFAQEEDISLDGPEWALVAALARNEWFERGWVVREASLAREAVVVWGDTVLQWDDLIRTALWTGTRAKKNKNLAVAYRIRCHFETYKTRHQNYSSVCFQEGDWFEPSLLDYMGFARILRLKNHAIGFMRFWT